MILKITMIAMISQVKKLNQIKTNLLYLLI